MNHHGIRTTSLIASLSLILAGAGAVGGGSLPARADEPDCHKASASDGGRVGGAKYTNTVERYEIPGLTLINQDAEEIELTEALYGDRPVAVNFIFTTCTTICPVMSATFAKLQRELGDDASNLQFVSISIDPEYDTPPRMKRYLGTWGAGENWQFLTGSQKQIDAVLDGFHALHGSKMNHRPLTFFHVPGRDEWVRIEGLASAAALADEYRRLIGG